MFHLNRSGLASENQQSVIRHVKRQIDENINTVLANKMSCLHI